MGLFKKHGVGDSGSGGGVPGAAKIVAVKNGGSRQDMGPVLNLHLLVTLPGEIPFPVSVPEALSPSLVLRAKPGTKVPVSFDRATRAVAIHWEAVPA